MERPPNPVTESIDGATGDITMSGDAMRWSPELAEGQGRAVGPLPSGALPGVDVAAGFGALLGLDAPGVRRLVTGAVSSLATVAGDVVAELRQLTRGADQDDADGDDADPDDADLHDADPDDADLDLDDADPDDADPDDADRDDRGRDAADRDDGDQDEDGGGDDPAGLPPPPST